MVVSPTGGMSEMIEVHTVMAILIEGMVEMIGREAGTLIGISTGKMGEMIGGDAIVIPTLIQSIEMNMGDEHFREGSLP